MQAAKEAIAATLRRSEGVIFFVKSKKNGKLPKGSMMINNGIKIVIKDSNVCMMTT